MATVYLARDLKHDREVALKVLRSDLSAVIGTERFLAEVRIAARLDHPHILTLIDSGEADGILFYVLPYVRGESLRAKIEREKQLSVEDALSIIRQVASALDYAHESGVVHRDIKPENILLHEGEAVLADFGIALAVKEAGGNRLTETGLSLGTPQYMSPEQATGDRTLDRRSDVYSLGAVFYEMIAGEPPVTGATAQAMIAKLLTEKPVSLRVVRGTIPVTMDTATQKALAKVPADRFSSAGAFVAALSAVAPESADDGKRSKHWWALGGIAAAAIVGAGIWFATHNSQNSQRVPAMLRDRAQLTNTGDVSLPVISPDGKSFAYVVTDCNSRGCRYGIEMRDVGGGASRRLFDGATALYGLEISPDRRNVLLIGSIDGSYASFMVPVLGGAVRRIIDGQAAFYADGDSLLMVRSGRATKVFWILVSGLDGVPVDSIRVDGPADALNSFAPVPGSSRILYSLTTGSRTEWYSSDRAGKRSEMFSQVDRVIRSQATADALWLTVPVKATRNVAVVRLPFDASSGTVSYPGDTVYTGPATGASVTSDGGTLLVDEGFTGFTAWTMSLDDVVKGRFTDSNKLFGGTTSIGFSLSPDGKWLALGRDPGGASTGGRQWSVMPYPRGAEIQIPGRHSAAALIDSTRMVLYDVEGSRTTVSDFDFRSRKSGARFTIPDSDARDIDRVSENQWGWIPPNGTSIKLQRTGETSARTYSIPPWYHGVYKLHGNPDGTSLAFLGWKAPNQDSLALGILDLSDGKFLKVWAGFAEGGAIRWMDDGGILLVLFDTPESISFYRVGREGSQVRIGSMPRPMAGVTVSRDLKRAVVMSKDYKGDAWISKVVRPGK